VAQNLKSAKLTVIVYILICFEVGIMLVVLPWLPSYWDDNFFLYFITGKLNSPGLQSFLTSGWMKGLVTGLGLVNIGAGVWDIIKFRASVAALSGSPLPATPSLNSDTPNRLT
jgi:hypothetical protein